MKENGRGKIRVLWILAEIPTAGWGWPRGMQHRTAGLAVALLSPAVTSAWAGSQAFLCLCFPICAVGCHSSHT